MEDRSPWYSHPPIPEANLPDENLESRLANMQAVILAGGRGMRLNEKTELLPKPMIEIGHHPLLWHIMKIYSRAGVRRFVICLGYKGELIKRFFLDYRLLSSDLRVNTATEEVETLTDGHEDWEIVLVDTGLESGTAERVKRVEPYIEGDGFFVTYGDGLADVDLYDLLRFHLDGKWVATLTGVHPVGRFGHLTLERDRVQSFVEKPVEIDGWVNGGFYIFSRQIFDYLDSEMLEVGPLEKLAKEGRLGVHRHHGFWACMDTYRDYEALEKEWESGCPGWLR